MLPGVAGRIFDILEPTGTKWRGFKHITFAGNYLLMMFYTVISGWLVWYFVEIMNGRFQGLMTAEVSEVFSSLFSSPGIMAVCTVESITISVLVCAVGVQKGAEKITKILMLILFALLIVLVVKPVLLPGAELGLRYYLYPDFRRMKEIGLTECVFAAMGQAFLH